MSERDLYLAHLESRLRATESKIEQLKAERNAANDQVRRLERGLSHIERSFGINTQ